MHPLSIPPLHSFTYTKNWASQTIPFFPCRRQNNPFLRIRSQFSGTRKSYTVTEIIPIEYRNTACIANKAYRVYEHYFSNLLISKMTPVNIQKTNIKLMLHHIDKKYTCIASNCNSHREKLALSQRGSRTRVTTQNELGPILID